MSVLDQPKVLYLIDSLAPGGAEKSLVEMTPGLLSCGIRLDVAVLHDRGGLASQLRSYGVGVHLVKGENRPAWILNSARLVRYIRPDVVHTTLFESDVAGRLAAFATQVPVVSTLASTPYGADHSTETGVSRTRFRAARAVDSITARLVTRFHAVSHSAAQAGITRLHIPPTRIDVIPRGRDPRRLGERTVSRRRAVRDRLQLADDVPMIFAASRQEPQKGIDTLLQAVPMLLEFSPSAAVVIAGREGRSTPSYGALLVESRVKDAVRFLGERDDVPDLLAAADVFVLPSLREGLPGAVLEAMAVGTPIVASDLPPVREALPDSKYGYLVPPAQPARLAEALIDALSNPVESASRSERAKRRFHESFDIAGVSAAMADFYRKVLATP